MPSILAEGSRGGHEQARPRISQPLQYTGSLDPYQKADLTPAIGREFYGLQVADILKAEDSERFIKDLAVTSMLEFIVPGIDVSIRLTAQSHNEESSSFVTRMSRRSKCVSLENV